MRRLREAEVAEGLTSEDGAGKKSMVVAGIDGPPSECAMRVLLLIATEKLGGDGDLKEDMPLTSVPATRLGLLLRSGVLLGKVVARFLPGLFDPFCLRTKGGELMWRQNVEKVFEACSFLSNKLRDALLAGSQEAAAVALRLILVNALSSRAREQCRSFLGARADSWPWQSLVAAWVMHYSGDGFNNGEMWQVDVPPPTTLPELELVVKALAQNGPLDPKRAATANGSLQKLLQGSPLDGCCSELENERSLPRDALELVLLWAVAKNNQKLKLRSSVKRAAGSDTSWIDRMK